MNTYLKKCRVLLAT